MKEVDGGSTFLDFYFRQFKKFHKVPASEVRTGRIGADIYKDGWGHLKIDYNFKILGEGGDILWVGGDMIDGKVGTLSAAVRCTYF